MRLYGNTSTFNLNEYIRLNDTTCTEKIAELKFSKGEYIYLPHTKSNDVYELLNGAIKIGSYSKKGLDVPYEIISPGDVFGNMNYLGGKFFFEYARALTSCTVKSYPLVYFKELTISDPTVAKWYNLNAIRRWCRLEGRLFVICSEGSAERLAYLESKLDFTITDNEGHSVNVFRSLTKSDIASFLGMTRQTVATLLKRKHLSR